MGWSQGGVKQNPKKSVGFQTKLKKIPGPKMNPPPPQKKKNVPDFHVEPHWSSDCFEHLYKSLLKSRHPKKYLPNFPTQKDPRMENLKPKKVSPPGL